MHHELIFMHWSYIHTSWEDFIPRRNLCIARILHTLRNLWIAGRYSCPQKIMHRESIFMYRRRSCIEIQYSCISEDHASRVNIHASEVNMHAPREDFIPRINLFIARRFHTLRNLCIAGRYSCLAEDHVSRVNIQASSKIMHRESIFMHRGRLCITS